tara:strand:- start:5868 stop:6254 length:387 start_codon:yes stop_codon:yes gene_type:complete
MLYMKIARFALRNPKTIMFGVLGAVLLAGFIHYRIVLGKNEALEAREVEYKKAVAAFELREEQLAEDARIASEATIEAIAQREAYRAALDTLRQGRENDPEAVEWASQALPEGEIARLCAALPRMSGC